MTALRAFTPLDLFKMNLTNLDPLTENYDLHFYFQYLAKWPSLFTVAEGQHGEITGYSQSLTPPLPLPFKIPRLTTQPVNISTVMGKVEEDPPYLHLTEHYLPWHGHVTALSVAPQYRRLGLAQTLTGALERGCESQKAWFVDLFVREGNETAIGLYKGLGYVFYNPPPPAVA